MRKINFSRWMLVSAQLSIISLILLFHPAIAESGRLPRILVFGDSLSSAYGIPKEKGWVALLQDRLQGQVEIVNASISGETTQGGLTRLPQALENHSPDLMLLELGGNDGLRGIPVSTMKDNLKNMIELAQRQGVDVVLLGIKIPPNYGFAYTRAFEQVFADLAEKYQLKLVPFILDGVATDFGLMQEDGIHPTAEAQSIVLENIFPTVQTQLEIVTDGKAGKSAADI